MTPSPYLGEIDGSDEESCVDLETERVTVSHRGRVIEVLQRPGSWDDFVYGSILFVGVVGLIAALTNPISIATWLLSPFMLLFLALGGFWFLQRLRQPEVRIDRLSWRATGLGPSRSFGGPPEACLRTTVYFAGGLPKRHWAVELRGGGHRHMVVNGLLARDEAQEVADCLNALMAS